MSLRKPFKRGPVRGSKDTASEFRMTDPRRLDAGGHNRDKMSSERMGSVFHEVYIHGKRLLVNTAF